MPTLTIPKNDRFAVRSSRDPEKVYEVVIGPKGECWCDCEDFSFERSRATKATGKCKHVRKVLALRRKAGQ